MAIPERHGRRATAQAHHRLQISHSSSRTHGLDAIGSGHGHGRWRNVSVSVSRLQARSSDPLIPRQLVIRVQDLRKHQVHVNPAEYVYCVPPKYPDTVIGHFSFVQASQPVTAGQPTDQGYLQIHSCSSVETRYRQWSQACMHHALWDPALTMLNLYSNFIGISNQAQSR